MGQTLAIPQVDDSNARYGPEFFLESSQQAASSLVRTWIEIDTVLNPYTFPRIGEREEKETKLLQHPDIIEIPTQIIPKSLRLSRSTTTDSSGAIIPLFNLEVSISVTTPSILSIYYATYRHHSQLDTFHLLHPELSQPIRIPVNPGFQQNMSITLPQCFVEFLAFFQLVFTLKSRGYDYRSLFLNPTSSKAARNPYVAAFSAQNIPLRRYTQLTGHIGDSKFSPLVLSVHSITQSYPIIEWVNLNTAAILRTVGLERMQQHISSSLSNQLQAQQANKTGSRRHDPSQHEHQHTYMEDLSINMTREANNQEQQRGRRRPHEDTMPGFRSTEEHDVPPTVVDISSFQFENDFHSVSPSSLPESSSTTSSSTFSSSSSNTPLSPSTTLNTLAITPDSLVSGSTTGAISPRPSSPPLAGQSSQLQTPVSTSSTSLSGHNFLDHDYGMAPGSLHSGDRAHTCSTTGDIPARLSLLYTNTQSIQLKSYTHHIRFHKGEMEVLDLYGWVEKPPPDNDHDEDPNDVDDINHVTVTVGSYDHSGFPNLDYIANECVICMTDLSTHVIYPCRHLCLCDHCAKELLKQQHLYQQSLASNITPSNTNSGKCPVCRQLMTSIFHLAVASSGNGDDFDQGQQ